MTTTKAARPEVLMTGILLGESPRWRGGKLWFADWVAEKLYTLDETGGSEVVARIPSLPFSIDWLPDGRLLVVNAREKRLMRRETDGGFVTHADTSALSEYGCNEIVVDRRGAIFINNIDFEFPGGEFKPGFIAVVTPDGGVRKVAEGLAFPNGMAITPDEKTLVCAESFSGLITAFDIEPDGGLSNRRVWAKLEGQGGDGVCFDAEGALWVAAGPRCIRLREGGEVLDEVRTDRMCFACMLGGDDGKTLYIVAADWTGTVDLANSEPTGQIQAVRVAVPHGGRP